jgi:ATP-dependent DNA helicase UvrD/PcrA
MPAVTSPGPAELGRSVVVVPGGEVPSAWTDCDRVVVSSALLADPDQLSGMVNDLQRRYVRRIPTVFELGVSDTELNTPESTNLPPYELGATFTFLRERLAKAVWHNSYDARTDQLIWWWSRKAEARLQVLVDGPADVRLPNGEPVWVDGGPRQQLDLAERVIHHESVGFALQPTPSSSSMPVEDLAQDQKDAVFHGVGPARIIAPAGSGKTRVLTARMRYLIGDRGIEPEIVTAVAYNRLAATEMKDRLRGEGRLNIRTIHSLGWEILRMAKPRLRLIDEREQRQRLQSIVSAPPRVNTDVIGPYLEALGEVRVGLRSPEEVEEGRDDIPVFAEAFDRYREALDSRDEADHDEQIYGAIEALCRDPDLRAHWQTQCQHLLVDEFQDLTPGYLLLLRLLASPGMNVFGVGDDDQVIYGYAGADPGFLIGFQDLFPGAGAHALEVNYRCPADVVEAAVKLLSYNSRRVDKVIRGSAESKGLEIIRAPGDDLGVIAADHVAGRLEKGATPDSIGVLTRVNSTLLPVQVALAVREIPFQSILTASLLNRTVLRAALAWMRLALDPDSMSRNDLLEAVRRPGRGINRLFGELTGRTSGPLSVEGLLEIGQDLEGRRLERWRGFCDDILSAATAANSTPRLLEVLATQIGLDRAASALDAGRSRADRASQSDDLAALRRLAALGPEPGSFEPWLREQLSVPSSPDGVTLSSVHRAKGLEWDHVLVFGADSGSMPHSLSNDIEEERRVFHVAVTRGRTSVVVLSDKDRQSRFLAELEGKAPVVDDTPEPKPPPRPVRREDVGLSVSLGDMISVPGGHEGVVVEIEATGVLVRLGEGGAEMLIHWGERIGRDRRSGELAHGLDSDERDLLKQLKAWRLERAQSQGVPAFVVFSDRTLEAIVSARPSSPEGLLEVPGIGPAKLEAYGDDLLDLLADA